MLGFGHDEEVGGRNGAEKIAKLLKERGVHAEWVLDEGSAIANGVFPGVQPPLALIGVAEKGYATIELIAKGGGGHSSMPPYDTAVTRLARAITRLQENPFSAGSNATSSEMFRALGPSLPFYGRAAIANEWLFSPLLDRALSVSPPLNAILRTTIAPTMLVASPKDNVLPTEARATVNLRIHPRDSVESALKHVRALFAADREIRVELAAGSGFSNDPSALSSTNSSGYAAIERSAREVFPDAIVSPYLVIAATDSRHYAGVAKDIYRFGPFVLNQDDLERPHGINERISVEGFCNLVRFYIRLLENTNG
jgi:carboxypeptidase PM20D1